jgi:hypothetical protein
VDWPTGVIRLKTWESIRLRCRRDGEKIKVVARDLSLAPNTVRKYARSEEPPRRKQRPRAHLLDHYQSHIDELIRATPRITAVRIGTYLRANVDGELSIEESRLRKYVAWRRRVLVLKEAFVRASYSAADEAQFDFSPVEVRLAGVLVVVQVFAVRLSDSGRYFARASLRFDQVSLFAGLPLGPVGQARKLTVTERPSPEGWDGLECERGCCSMIDCKLALNHWRTRSINRDK